MSLKEAEFLRIRVVSGTYSTLAQIRGETILRMKLLTVLWECLFKMFSILHVFTTCSMGLITRQSSSSMTIGSTIHEYFLADGQSISNKVDDFSYRMVLLEIISERRTRVSSNHMGTPRIYCSSPAGLSERLRHRRSWTWWTVQCSWQGWWIRRRWGIYPSQEQPADFKIVPAHWAQGWTASNLSSNFQLHIWSM